MNELYSALSQRNKRKAWKFFGYQTYDSHRGLVLHHKDESLRQNDLERYIQWIPEDLEIMTTSEHMKHHMDNITPEWRQHLCDSKAGKNNPMYGKNFSEEHRRHLSESHKGKKYNKKGGSKCQI